MSASQNCGILNLGAVCVAIANVKRNDPGDNLTDNLLNDYRCRRLDGHYLDGHYSEQAPSESAWAFCIGVLSVVLSAQAIRYERYLPFTLNRSNMGGCNPIAAIDNRA
ncbi:MAG: hypothetical protein ACTS2F_20600 [Thainema sp.]